MILLCELSFNDAAHVPFNAGLLATIGSAFPEEELSFFGAPAHLEALKTEVGKQVAGSIAWKEIIPPPPGTTYSKRFFCEFSILRRLLRNLPYGQTCRLLLTSAYPSTVLALKAARMFESKQTPVQIVLHGFNGVGGRGSRHPIRRFQDMKTAVTLLRNESIQYLVLEQSIREIVVKSLPFLSGKVESFDHPISPNEGASQMLELSEPIRFGFLGLADRAKGFPSFIELANEIGEKYGQRAEFHAIGRYPQNGSHLNGTDALLTKPMCTRMTRSDFINGIMPLHYIVLPHDALSYKFWASGVLLDAIALKKPVIARKIPIFESLFEKHGDIGHLFGDDAELIGIAEEILQSGDNARYQRQVLRLRNVALSRSPQALAKVYQDICRKNS
jgi:hypothetical protein